VENGPAVLVMIQTSTGDPNDIFAIENCYRYLWFLLTDFNNAVTVAIIDDYCMCL